MFSARPAGVIEIIEVSQHITGDRDISVKEPQSCFELRNHIRDLMRNAANRTRELAEKEIIQGA